MRNFLLPAGVVVLALAPLVACESNEEPGQTSGGGASGPTSTTGAAGGPACGNLESAFLEPGCYECAQSTCCDQLAACDTDACAERYSCEAACADATCVGQCAANAPDEGAASEVVTCMTACSDVCTPPTKICDTMLTMGTPECDTCLGDNCCAEINACLADSTCQACIDTGDVDGCETNSFYETMLTCFATCETSCEA